MVILSIHNSADIYGASQCLLRMFRLFVKDGHEVHVVLPSNGPLVELLRAQGIIVHIFPSLVIIDRAQLGSLKGKMGFCFNLLWSVCWLSMLVLRIKANVVHTNTAVLPAAGLAARLTGRRHLWHVREFFSEFPSVWKIYQRFMWLTSTTLVTISSAVRNQFDTRFQKRCVIIYDGLDDEAAAVDFSRARNFRSSIGDPSFLVGVVGRIKWERKGQEVLVKAAAILASSHPEAQYVVVGSVASGNENHLTRLHDLIHTLGLEDRVIFTGDIRNTRDIFAAFDVTVVPSVLAEPFGCVVMESMVTGTPVIGSRCGGIPEQIVDGTTGLLFRSGDEDDLARALEKLISNDLLRIELGQAGKKYAQEHFNMAEAYLRFAEVFKASESSTF